MTTTSVKSPVLSDPVARRRVYWIATGLFCLLFLGSAGLTVIDYPGSVAITEFLGYPAWTVYPLAAAKVLGVAAILWNRSNALTVFAFAGFFFDLLLAAGGHLSRSDPQIILAIVGLILWTCAFTVDRRGFRKPATP